MFGQGFVARGKRRSTGEYWIVCVDPILAGVPTTPVNDATGRFSTPKSTLIVEYLEFSLGRVSWTAGNVGDVIEGDNRASDCIKYVKHVGESNSFGEPPVLVAVLIHTSTLA